MGMYTKWAVNAPLRPGTDPSELFSALDSLPLWIPRQRETSSPRGSSFRALNSSDTSVPGRRGALTAHFVYMPMSFPLTVRGCLR